MSWMPPGLLRHCSPYCMPPSVSGITSTAASVGWVSSKLRKVGITPMTSTQACGLPGEPCSSSMTGNLVCG